MNPSYKPLLKNHVSLITLILIWVKLQKQTDWITYTYCIFLNIFYDGAITSTIQAVHCYEGENGDTWGYCCGNNPCKTLP